MPLAFSGAEALLFVLLAVYCGRAIGYAPRAELGPWIRRHRAFGLKAFFTGLLLDCNTKIDIVVLGYFASDAVVGVYAFAANVAEGLAQIPIAVQAVLTPLISRIAISRDAGALDDVVRRTVLWTSPVLAVIGLVVVAIYAPAVTWITADPAYGDGWQFLAILAFGVVLSAGYVPFALIPNQAGHPHAQLFLLAAAVATNLALNLALVPTLGPIGAAIGTAAAAILLPLYLALTVRRAVALSLWPMSRR